MKKVGIVTMVGYDNYGNLLQNYAVTKLLEDMGYQAITLNNYLDEQEQNNNKVGIWSKLKLRYICNFLKAKVLQLTGGKNYSDYLPIRFLKLWGNRNNFQKCKEQRFNKFKDFREKYIPYDELPIVDSSFKEEDYLAFICGSDVVWHPTYHYNKVNDFLGFAQPYKRIALAPSFGASEISPNRQEDYRTWISGIKYLSVREDAGAEIIRNLTGREAEVLPDPTLSISANHWREISKKPKNVPENSYILCYFLGNITSEYSKWIKKCKKLKGKEIISICDANFLQYYATDPSEFLWLIDHADAVFTDSFHGIVFSMLFHTPFVAFRRVEEGLSIFSRIESLLHCMKMEAREFGKVTFDQIDQVDFGYINEKINKLRGKEISYLRNAFSEIDKK